MHDIAERQQIFGEIGAVLAGHAGDESDPLGHSYPDLLVPIGGAVRAFVAVDVTPFFDRTAAPVNTYGTQWRLKRVKRSDSESLSRFYT
ncbi:hypothetical protein BRDID11004_28810 [Bradyrhizobium diazoefficiens]|uniref:Uncharacterized protein n=1 Tax=Bradyrhizobium diazoefficiens TaxID=1355477 RepID=A0A810A348_9BRAD|nr:hypothetical protein F07S3_60450 [Bradyrhizobium diazoefficiens]BCA13897.1 hypothetical protein BDHF08_57440 [Bradyrhizobium diazoefficiens]BCE58307.1 hypothetical protein XF5B_58190 [Bradyrhizobium diazoefficiens]BCE66984.1 hypothetical protein XF6B_57830 [Bradyrhizobium diazoefficiens]BCE75592.1 hypothetical protein XF8B_57030 [Bradyrhizobium diazoefficiens]